MTTAADFSMGPAMNSGEVPGVGRVSRQSKNLRDRSGRRKKRRSGEAKKQPAPAGEEDPPRDQPDAENLPTGDEDEHIVDYLA